MSPESIEIAVSYNSLPTVFEADQALNGNRREDALQTLCSVITNHGLQEYLGIRLLHKHSNIENGEVMVEDVELDEHLGFALVTQPRSYVATRPIRSANSWHLVNGRYLPSEFSSSRLLAAPVVSPETQRRCFSEFSVALLDLKVETILGPSLNLGDSVEFHRPPGDTILLEVTDDASRRNIVRFVNSSEVDVSHVVETVWQVEASASSVPPPKPKRTCRRICPSVKRGDKAVHQGTFIHHPS